MMVMVVGTEPPVGFTDIPGALPDNGEVLAPYAALPDRSVLFYNISLLD
jgi:hypothetical protein